MRPEPNSDIDLLLRQLSRRNGIPVSEIDEQHLDADELNSYVANALPAAARARYTTHLADCSTCRKLVVDLSAAHGPVPVVQHAATAVAPSGLKSFLASLFSPMVLRYAVPALGLILVAVIGLFVWRQDGRNRSIALNESPQNTAPAAGVPRDSQTSEYASPDVNSRARTETRQRQPVASIAKEDQAAPVPESAPAAVGNRTGDATGTSAAAPPPAPKAVPAETDSGRIAEFQKDKKAEVAIARDGIKERAAEADKNQPKKAEDETVTVTPGTAARRNIEVRPAKTAEAPRSVGGAAAGKDMNRAPVRAQTQSREETKDAEAAAETRSVAGRRFRKSARVWIDTGYDSSKPITTVARGSEQYRALVADEPSIRTIADELDGEIIVVWKSRTYRIR